MAAGNLSRGKRAPDKKNKGKMRKFMIRLNPDISSIGLVAPVSLILRPVFTIADNEPPAISAIPPGRLRDAV